jgi:hypothetical protein
MAKIKLGGMVGMVSGSVGGMTYSHNRYGTYARRRATPTKVTSEKAESAKQFMTTLSRDWSTVSAANRLAWGIWAQNNPVMDRLGDRQVLSGNAAYMRLNNLLAQYGTAVIESPPVGLAPVGLTSMTLSADLGVGGFHIDFTPTPIGANEKLLLWAAVTGSATQNYVENKYRLIAASAAAQATEWACYGIISARLGTMVVGNNVHVRCQVFNVLTGLRSGPISTSAIVVNTI